MPIIITPPSSAGGSTTLTGLTDTPAGYGNNGDVLTSNGADAATWVAPAGAFAWPADAWQAHASTIGIGTGTALVAADYPDLSVADAGVALAGGPTLAADGKVTMSPTSGTVEATPAGVNLASVAAGDYTVVVELSHLFTGGSADEAADSVYWEMGLVGFTGTDSSAGAVSGVVCGRALDKIQTNYLSKWNSAAGRGAMAKVTVQDYALAPGRSMSMAIVRTGNDIKSYIGDGVAWDFIAVETEASAPASIVGLLCSCQSAAATLTVGLRNLLVLDDGAAGAGTLPNW